MVTEREKREVQENAYYENRYAKAMLTAGKLDEYLHYLNTTHHKLKNGMTAAEIDAVQKRAEEAANE